MAKFPYLTSRRGTNNLYYKRLVPLELRAAGRPGQIWRSLRTSDRKKAEAAYGAAVRHILKARAGNRRFSPHSLRAGFITAAAPGEGISPRGT